MREQHEAIANTFGIDELMDRENKRAPIARDAAEQTHDLARLPEVEAVERLVHDKKRMRCEQRER